MQGLLSSGLRIGKCFPLHFIRTNKANPAQIQGVNAGRGVIVAIFTSYFRVYLMT